MGRLRISAKNLGAVALSNFCPRCFWIKTHCKNLPYQIFPGIFSSIDSYSKKITNYYFVKHSKLPNWLSNFGQLGKPIHVPHFSKFNIVDEETNILLTGVPDEIFVNDFGNHFIVDYKTAKFTGTQDQLLPMYEIQLNAYAHIAENCGMSPVTGLGLIYYEPFTDITSEDINKFVGQDTFVMHFTGKLLNIDIDFSRLRKALSVARDVYESRSIPDRKGECSECDRLEELLSVALPERDVEYERELHSQEG